MELSFLKTLLEFKGPITTALLIVCILEFRWILRKFMAMHEKSIKECSENNDKMRVTVSDSLSKLIDVLKNSNNHKTDP
jgi:hypothetical protein